MSDDEFHGFSPDEILKPLVINKETAEVIRAHKAKGRPTGTTKVNMETVSRGFKEEEIPRRIIIKENPSIDGGIKVEREKFKVG